MDSLRSVVREAAQKALAEHLPGKHRQKDHAGGGSGADTSAPTDLKAAWGGRAEEIAKAKTSPKGMYDDAVLRSAYEGTFAGFTTKISGKHLDAESKSVVVGGNIFKDGVLVGKFKRILEGDTAEHEFLKLDDTFQGSGFAREFNRNAENHYIANGIKKITLQANISVGGYAWARQGYDFSAKGDLVFTRMRVASHVESPHIKDRISPEAVTSFKKQVEAAEHSWDLASITIATRDGEMLPIGKMSMLRSNWMGVKNLQPGNPTYEVGEVAYQQKKGKK